MPSKILIIEDQAPMRRNIALMLDMEGYTTCTAGDGAAGLETLRKERPDLVLCDVMMPELDGYGVLKALRADADLCHVPLIFLSAKSDKLDIQAGIDMGANSYLTKPVVREELLAAVEAQLAAGA